jgi:trans-aconitate methyltransferase
MMVRMTGQDPAIRFDPETPSTARMYDYYLGGKDNYPADRDAAEEVMAMMPPGAIKTAARQNRMFLGRAVRYLARRGVRQFLDIGTGLPTMGNVHEVAQEIDPDCSIIYVDHDPVVLAHGHDMLKSARRTAIIGYDLREPEAILADHQLRDHLDLSQPVAVLLIAVLHFIQDREDPHGILARLMGALAPGSYLVISHATGDSYRELDQAIQVYDSATSSMHNRTRAEVESLFSGLELVEPGVVWLPQWHPDPDTGLADDPGKSLCWCGAARKR